MTLLSIPRDYILRTNKLHCPERLAELDIDAALPPTDSLPQDRGALLDELCSIEAEFDALGATEQERDVVLMAEAQWEFDDDE